MNDTGATKAERGLELARWILKVGVGAGSFLAGLDKYFDVLATWSMYMAPWASKLLPIPETSFFHVVGAFEMAAGLLVLTRWTRLGAYVLSAWLLAISIQLATSGMFYDLALRDVEMAMGAFALAKLTEWHASRARPARPEGA
jgi:hypothetical protein